MPSEITNRINKSRKKREIRKVRDLDGKEVDEQVKRIKMLIRKRKEKFKELEEIVTLKEPVLQLMRRDGVIEIYEGMTEGEYEYVHSDGEPRIMLFRRAKQFTLTYGRDVCKCYIAHEDEITPYPVDPIVTSEEFTHIILKTRDDVDKYKAAEIEAQGMKWQNILIGLAILGIVLVVIYMMVGKDFFGPEAAQRAAEIAEAKAREAAAQAAINATINTTGTIIK